MGRSLLNLLHENCDPELAKDTSLPCTAYIIEYNTEGGVQHDIVISAKKSEIFDHYWDKYHSVISMKQTEGRANPKLWQDPNAKPAKKK